MCQIHDIGPDYLVLEYIEGQPLKGPLGPEEGVRLGVEIAEALDAAQRKGVMHRDLKPANIMVTSEGSVKLLDFGLAKKVANSDETATIEGTVLGTTAYMSPEQAEGKLLDPRSDIFSFGAVFYELVTGERAFQRESRAATLAALLTEEPKPVRLLPPDLPPEIDPLISRCLRQDR